MKYKLLFSAISVLFIVSSFAQTQYTKEDLTRIVPISPNAASLGLFGNIPVGHHTGVPQISIPIHEIDFHGLKIPIELNYHASGIKVAQEASSVGLGWALNAGGCISRQVMHLDDFTIVFGNYVSTRNKPQDPEGVDDLEYDSRDYLPFMGFDNTYDAEPDFFTYSFCSNSGCFYLEPRTQSNGFATIISKDNSTQIRYIESANKWEVFNAYGFKYVFGPTEDTRESTEVFSRSGSYTNAINTINRASFYLKGKPSITAWYLDAIVSPLNDSIKFKYKKEILLSKYQFSEEKYYRLSYTRNKLENLQDQYSYGSVNYSSNEQLVLTSIEYNGGSIEFGYDARTDLQISRSTNLTKKLTSISVYESMTSEFRDRKQRIKHCVLTHSYMGSGSYEYLRLMLNEVCFMSTDNSNNNDVRKYQFSYNPGNLPSKYSQSVDYWGYYNAGYYIRGTHRQTDISPMIYLDYSWEWDTLSFGGMDRSPDESHAKYGTLNSIKYPTGGKTVFEFELNDFTNKIKVGTPTGNKSLSCGGGLRVKRIIDLSNDIDTVSVRRFIYKKDGVSSGGLKITPVHYREIRLSDFYYGFLPYFYGAETYINIHSEGFSSSILNSGNVGYSYVEEHNITDNKNNGYTAYTFSNDTRGVNTSVFGVPTFISTSSGKPERTTHFNSDGIPVKNQIFKYKVFDKGTSRGFKCYAPPMYDPIFIVNNQLENDFKVQYYTIYSSCFLESKIIEEDYFSNGKITKTIEYGYDENSYLKNYQKTTINRDIYETYIKYPSDFTDDTSINMRNRHMIGVPVETISTLNGKVIDAQKTLYSVFETNEAFSCLPASIHSFKKTRPVDLSEYQNFYEKEIQIDAYNSSGNVLQHTDRSNLKIVYLWSFGVYPIAVIKNATVAVVDYALGELGTSIEELSWTRPDSNYLYDLQEKLPNAHVTLFTHKPQVGVTSISEPSGKSISYNYDGLGRLIHIKDSKDNKIESYNYTYSNK